MSQAVGKTKERVGWFIALVFMVLGTATRLHAVISARTMIDGLYRKQKRIQDLAVLQVEAEQVRAAVMTIERDTSAQPIQLTDLTETYLEDAAVVHVPQEPTSLVYGWQLEQTTLRFEHLTWDQISVFLKKVEDQRPPWRVQRLQLAPHNGEGLAGELTLEALRKSEI